MNNGGGNQCIIFKVEPAYDLHKRNSLWSSASGNMSQTAVGGFLLKMPAVHPDFRNIKI